MKQVIELNVPNTLKGQGVNGIFYEDPRICVSYKSSLFTFKCAKEDQSGTIQRFDKLVGNTIDQPIKNEIKLCIAANWELILTSRTSVPMRELDREALELNQREHLARLDKLCNFNNNPLPAKKAYSNVFTTYVSIEENNLEELR